MRTKYLAGLALASLLVLAACSTPDGGSVVLEPTVPAEDVALDEVDPSRSLLVSGDSKRTIRVLVDPDYGEQVIVMVSEGIVRAFDGAGHIASSSLPDRFTSLEIVSLGIDGAQMSPHIAVGSSQDFECLGPCIAMDAEAYEGVIDIEVENNAADGRLIDVHVVGAPYFDGLEGENDTPANAVDLPNLGFARLAAIETLDDEDWFRVNVSGSYDFRAPTGFAIDVNVFYLGDTSDSDGDEEFQVSAGSTEASGLLDGDLVRITAAEYAGTAFSSSYEIEGRP